MTHLKKFWWLYLLIVGAIITVAMNWTTIKGWFSGMSGQRISGERRGAGTGNPAEKPQICYDAGGFPFVWYGKNCPSTTLRTGVQNPSVEKPQVCYDAGGFPFVWYGKNCPSTTL